MAHWIYTFLLTACLLGTLPLELALHARVYARWKRWLLAVVPVAVLFVVWDALAVRAGWWSFDPRSVLPARVVGLPLEELAFFVVIPTCALLTFEAVRRLRPRWFR